MLAQRARTDSGIKRAHYWRRAVLLLIVLAWFGCSVEKNYKVLSFFFDGVPDPRLVSNSADAVFVAKQTGGVYYTHEPYAREACVDCHGASPGGIMVATVEQTVCLKCHAAVTEQHRFMHGPVVANACIWCHAPHESTIKPLLRATATQLCSQCHGPTMMGSPTSPAHEDLSRDCLECHTGHGGSDRYFLKGEHQRNLAPDAEPTSDGSP